MGLDIDWVIGSVAGVRTVSFEKPEVLNKVGFYSAVYSIDDFIRNIEKVSRHNLDFNNLIKCVFDQLDWLRLGVLEKKPKGRLVQKIINERRKLIECWKRDLIQVRMYCDDHNRRIEMLLNIDYKI